MPNFAEMKNVGPRVQPGCGSAVTIVAGGAGDNTQVTTAGFDRYVANTNTNAFLTAVPLVFLTTNEVAGQSLQFGLEVQHSEDAGFASGVTTVALRANTEVIIAGAASAQSLAFEGPSLNLTGFGRYVRFRYTPNLTSAATQTAQIGFGCLFAGAVVAPHA